MALPTDPSQSREEILARRRAAEEEALLREVDDAVRQDDLFTFGQRYGRMVAVGVGAALLAFGGFLYWQSTQEASRERESEALVAAMDQLQAGNIDAARTGASPLENDGGAGARAVARIMAAGTELARGRTDEGVKILDALAADTEAPEVFRDLARIRSVAARYDKMDKAQVVAQLGPLARPDSPWFGTAGELTAMALLDQGKRAEAGRLFADIAKAETVPEGLRSRARQMAGLLGVDAIQDVGRFMQQQRERQQSAAPAGAAPAA